jgi:uncharacterized peroxidase-related enzyme
MKHPISRYPVPDMSSLADDIRQKIEGVAEKTGFVPNVFATLAHRPDEFRAFFAYYDALMLRDGGLSKAEKEMIVVVTSAINKCQYCVISHGALLRIFSKEMLIADQLAINYHKADISLRQKAMLDFACKVAEHSSETCETDFETLKAHGFSDEDIWDIGAITAFFALSNRMASLIDMRPNDEFYNMAR